MELCWHEEKRQKCLAERGLDFSLAGHIFKGPVLEFPDDRKNYGEERWIATGFLDDRLVVVVYTDTSLGRRIISMRKANDREQEKFAKAMG